MMTWLKSPYGYVALAESGRWLVRGPIGLRVESGRKVGIYWVYRNGSRCNTDGTFASSVHFASKAKALAWAEARHQEIIFALAKKGLDSPGR
jgi:hypothetical protein